MKLSTSSVILLLYALSISGCATFSDRSGTVIMKHPQTMEFVDCKVDKWGTKLSYDRNEKCVEEYKSKGYVVWAEY